MLGNEYNKLGEGVITPQHTINLAFTRALLGPMDFTPGGFINRAPKDFKITSPTQVMGTRARQLAMSVIYPSPLTVFCDSPTNYLGQPGIEFLRAMPTVWDESVVLSGEVGKFIVIARRSGRTLVSGRDERRQCRSVASAAEIPRQGKMDAAQPCRRPRLDQLSGRCGINARSDGQNGAAAFAQFRRRFWRHHQQGKMKTMILNSSKLATLALGCLLAALAGCRTPKGTAVAPVQFPYSTMQVISNGDSDAVIAEKAAKVLPRPNQTDWMRLEWTFFLHFGPNTFHGVEWGSGREEPSLFNPTAFDADQWVSAMTDAGGKMIVLVCKHHDGLCLWPTRYTAHSVAASPWLDGKGDEVRAVADAARKYGLKLGVYLSPADLYQLRTNPKNPGGYYGDGSSNVLSVIPTDPASFKSDPSKGRTPAPGFTSYTYEVDDYNRYFLNQLYELLTRIWAD